MTKELPATMKELPVMAKEELIENAYAVFSDFPKPVQCTNHMDFEDAEFNEILLGVSRRELSMEQFGTISWGAMPCLNAAALAHFMPRLIEMAVDGNIDLDGEPFLCRFINSFHSFSDDKRFRVFGPEHRKTVAETFEFLRTHYRKLLELEGWLDEAEKGVRNWSE